MTEAAPKWPGVAVIIPALNEAGNLADLIREVRAEAVQWVIVVDNGSTDTTGQVACENGALVVTEPRRGYGFACAAGSKRALELGASAIVYMDGDHSSQPAELPHLLAPLNAGTADLVLGSRMLGEIQQGAMLMHQRFGNKVAAWITRRLYGVSVTDLAPFRAVTAALFTSLDMAEMTFGWPTEMTVKALRHGALVTEVPVSWHSRREGQSKVSGTVKGSLLAGYHILRVTVANSWGARSNRRT